MDSKDFEFLLKLAGATVSGVAASVAYGVATGVMVFCALVVLIDWKFEE